MNKKSKGTAYALWFFLGLIGGHKFYLGKTGMGLFYLLAGGGFLVLWAIDFFKLGSDVDNYNRHSHSNNIVQVNVNNF